MTMKRIALSLLVLVGLAAVPTFAHADGSGAVPTVVVTHDSTLQGAAPAATDAPAATPAPSAALHDPTNDPKGAIKDAEAARKSWPLLVLVILIGATKILAYAGGKLAPLGKWLSAGKHAMIVAAVGTLAAVAYDALANGGSIYAAGSAVLGSLLALTSSHAPPTAVAKAAGA